MAQESFDQLLNAVKQAESRGQRYDKSGQLTTSPKGAQGEMQVMPGTQTDPGYGVAPAKDKSAAEIARVGKDYLSAMLGKYGNEQHALVAYNWGPKNADNWLASGANPAKLPAETQNYLKKVQEYKGSPLAGGAVPKKQAKVADVNLRDAGESYKTALAMSYMIDSQGKKGEKDEEDMFKEDETPEAAAPSPLAGLELKYSTPFPAAKPTAAQQLAQFAQGGVVHRADGSPETGEVKEPWLPQVSSYSELTAQDMYPGQQGQFDQRDAARHMLAAGTLARKYGPTAAELMGKAHEITTSPFRYIGSKLGISDMPVDYEQDLHNNKLGIELAARSKSQKDLEDLVMQMAEQHRGAQMQGKPWTGRPVRRADGSPETGELTPEEIAAASQPAFVTPKSGIGRQAGPISEALNTGTAYPAIARGVAELPYDVVGAPVDLVTMAMRPFGYKDEKPVGGSEWIKEKMTQYGIRPGEEANPTLQGFRTMGELAASGTNPTKAATKVGQAVEKGTAFVGKEAARQMLRGMGGEGPLASVSPPVMTIVRPSGGLFPTSKVTKEGGTWVTDQPKSNLDVEWAPILDKIVDQTNEFGPEKTDAMMEMFGQKLKSYYSKQAGGPNDPLRTAVLSGKVKFNEDSPLNDMFPKALIDAAQKKDITALRLLEKQYDKMLDIRSGYFRREGADYVRGQGPESLQQNILEQMKTHPEVLSDDMILRYARQDISNMNPQQMKAAADKVRVAIKENPERFSTVLEPNVSRTFGPNMGEVMYESVLKSTPRQYPYAYTQQETLPDLAVQTAIDKGQPLYDISHPEGRWMTNRLLDMDNSTLVTTASRMDPKELSRMSFPEFVVKAHQENQRVHDIMGRAPEVEKALKAGKPMPSDLSSFGVREFMPTANGFRWMEITQPEATALQAKALGNSIAGYSRDGSYGSVNMGKAGLDTGAVRLFALYNKENTPVTHVEYITDKIKTVKPEKAEKANTIQQFFGNGPLTGNVTPADYIDQVDDLVTKLDVTDIPPSIKQLMQKHGRFADGGSVERVTGDNRRYL